MAGLALGRVTAGTAALFFFPVLCMARVDSQGWGLLHPSDALRKVLKSLLILNSSTYPRILCHLENPDENSQSVLQKEQLSAADFFV